MYRETYGKPFNKNTPRSSLPPSATSGCGVTARALSGHCLMAASIAGVRTLASSQPAPAWTTPTKVSPEPAVASLPQSPRPCWLCFLEGGGGVFFEFVSLRGPLSVFCLVCLGGGLLFIFSLGGGGRCFRGLLCLFGVPLDKYSPSCKTAKT